MPRRNRRETKTSRPAPPVEPTPSPDYEDMARALVKSGARSQLILERPYRFTERNRP